MTEQDWNKRYKRARTIIQIAGIVILVGFIVAGIIIISSPSGM